MTIAPWVTPTNGDAVVHTDLGFSNNTGATWASPTSANHPQTPGGAHGRDRFRHTFVIPAGVTGTWQATVSSYDLFDNGINDPPELLYDGVSQGLITPVYSSRTFTFPATPGPHEIQYLVGQSSGTVGVSRLFTSFNFDHVRRSPAASQLCGCKIGDACYQTITGAAPLGRAVVEQLPDGSLIYFDALDGAVVPAADIRACPARA